MRVFLEIEGEYVNNANWKQELKKKKEEVYKNFAFLYLPISCLNIWVSHYHLDKHLSKVHRRSP